MDVILYAIVIAVMIIGAIVLAIVYFKKEKKENENSPVLTKVKRPRSENKKRYEPKINNKEDN